MIDAHRRYFRWWEGYFLVVATAVAVGIMVGDFVPLWRRLLAAGAIAAMVGLHLAAGRRLIDQNREDAPSIAVACGHIALFAAGIVASPVTTWLLFALIPMIFHLVSVRAAIWLVIAANLVTPVYDLVTGSSQLLMDSIIAVISAAGGIWLGFWIVRVIEQNIERGNLILELEASRAEVSRLSHEAGVAAERARLAGEIHDTLAQGFTSIITLLQAADPELADERLALAVRTAKENLAESRALVAALAPAALSEGSLPDSVRRQAARFTEETGTPCSLRITGDERALPTTVEVVLLRACQEALANIRRHAGADESAVLLAYGPDAVRLVVRDDGHGFDPVAAAGFGLNGMRARASQVGGTVAVHSDPSTGTTIEVEVPA